MIRRATALTAALAATLFGAALTASSANAAPSGPTAKSGASKAASSLFPTTINLPNGWAPEGIATGPGPFAYSGSLVDGSILRINLIDGSTKIVAKGPGTQSVGLKTDSAGRLFVAGGSAGDGRVVDTRTGRTLASFSFHAAPTFINDVVLTRDAAWFTDSVNQQLYKVPLRNGRPAASFQTLPLTGEIVWDNTPGAFNANGISGTPDGRALIIVQSSTGLLFRVNPATGVTTKVDLGAADATAGDGLLQLGRTLYVVQNQLNTVEVFRLNAAGTRGTLQKKLTSPGFDVPTTVASFGPRLYLVNARFNTTSGPDTTYTAVAIHK
jgi:sugar lactone lactonase YvrE